MRIRNRRWLAALSAAVFVGGASNVVIAQERSIEEVVGAWFQSRGSNCYRFAGSG